MVRRVNVKKRGHVRTKRVGIGVHDQRAQCEAHSTFQLDGTWSQEKEGDPSKLLGKKQRRKDGEGGSRCEKGKIERKTMKKEPRDFVLTGRHILLFRETAEARIRLSSQIVTHCNPNSGVV